MYRIARILIIAALSLLTACISLDDPTKDWTPERFYQEARERAAAGDWTAAIKNYEQLEARYPYGRYTEQGQLEVAYAHHKDGEPALAIAAADRFIRLHPTHPNVDYAYYLKGLINFRGERNIILALLGDDDDLQDRDIRSVRESYNAFRELLDRFPNSRYAKDAAQRMTYLVQAQANYEIHVARFYFDRGAYVAAVNRCKYTLENFPRTPAIEHALGIQTKAYRQMGLTSLADDTQRILEKNFPQSRYLKEIAELNAKG
ncbi:MAG: outer membrane protein assembly factor BamD [Gammaproteobacteria bacterium]|nr:outer membrane protein assembly factor BamD [Gammaproteobacteria bacterium]